MAQSRTAPAFPNFRQADADAANAATYLERLTRLLAHGKAFSIDLLELSPGQSVLEVGCGPGPGCDGHGRASWSDRAGGRRRSQP